MLPTCPDPNYDPLPLVLSLCGARILPRLIYLLVVTSIKLFVMPVLLQNLKNGRESFRAFEAVTKLRVIGFWHLLFMY